MTKHKQTVPENLPKHCSLDIPNNRDKPFTDARTSQWDPHPQKSLLDIPCKIALSLLLGRFPIHLFKKTHAPTPPAQISNHTQDCVWSELHRRRHGWRGQRTHTLYIIQNSSCSLTVTDRERRCRRGGGGGSGGGGGGSGGVGGGLGGHSRANRDKLYTSCNPQVQTGEEGV